MRARAGRDNRVKTRGAEIPHHAPRYNTSWVCMILTLSRGARVGSYTGTWEFNKSAHQNEQFVVYAILLTRRIPPFLRLGSHQLVRKYFVR